jgi:hypothetical protein
MPWFGQPRFGLPLVNALVHYAGYYSSIRIQAGLYQGKNRQKQVKPAGAVG